MTRSLGAAVARPPHLARDTSLRPQTILEGFFKPGFSNQESDDSGQYP